MNDRVNDAVTTKEGQLDVVGGINMLGCGINKLCWPGAVQPLNRALDAKQNEQEKVIDGKTYLIGERVDFTHRPQAMTLNETFESVAEYDKKSSVSANAKGKYGAFSGGFDSTFSHQISTLDQHYAGMRHDTQQLWTLGIKNLESNLHSEFVKAVKALPEFKEDLSTIDDFIDFFNRFGTDVVTEVTAGGSITYSVLIKKSASTKKTDLDVAISVGYGAFVANASTQISEEQKKQTQEQKVRITTMGGPANEAVKFDFNNPTNCHAAVENWRANLSQAPLVVDMQLAPIDEFVPREYKKQQEAVRKAREWCLSYQAEIDAGWQDSTISIKRAPKSDAAKQSDPLRAQAPASAGGSPALNIAIVGLKRELRGEEKLQAPGKDADAGAFAAFWQRVAEKLAGVSSKGHEMVLLASERWPRDSRYYPPVGVRKLLREHGASQATLDRWHDLVRHMQPCNIAGLTYVLAGRSLNGRPSDFVVAGFGTTADTISPTVNVTLRVIAGDASTTGALVTALTEKTNTKLHIIRNLDGEKAALAAGTQLKTTIEMVKADDSGTYLGQYWYFLRYPRYKETPNSHFIINYETGACLQSKVVEKTACELQAFGDDNPPRQDDILWDVRGEPAQTNFLALHYWPQAWNLTQSGKSAGVRNWLESYMLWSLEAFDNLHW
ncbi:MAG TPA: MAC/perforin domain-containing protein [Trinickia sp.]|uniref:MAC/perforin domain-containing protein n=1 Tax=Trinickia sp. TaxID=2571163 RepID=UPI002B6091E8|nr:MAC/perforin domain-containing protein [Trinickia sp.]HVW49852.1 MAC/perforin domain-containing protein [Trinickia sp.]